MSLHTLLSVGRCDANASDDLRCAVSTGVQITSEVGETGNCIHFLTRDINCLRSEVYRPIVLAATSNDKRATDQFDGSDMKSSASSVNLVLPLSIPINELHCNMIQSISRQNSMGTRTKPWPLAYT